MRLLKKCIGLLSGMCLTAGLMTGCGGSGGSGDTIAYLCFNEGDLFTGASIKREFDQRAQSKGLKVEYYDAKNDSNVQIDQLREAIDKNPKAIVLLAADTKSTIPMVERANERGIPVVTVSRHVDGGKAAKVKIENYEAGKIQGDFIVKNFPQGAKIVYLKGTSTTASAIDRWNGFKTECLDKHPNIELLDMQEGSYNKAEAMKIMSIWLSLYPKIDVAVCANDLMALGAVTALKQANRLGECKVIGVDAIDDALKAIKAGEMAETVKQDAGEYAQGAIDILAEFDKGNMEPADITLSFTAVNKSNLSKYLK